MAQSNHHATLETSSEHWTVRHGGVEIASSDEVILLHETYGDRRLPAVPYFPPSSLEVASSTTEHHTSCPIKGTADYLVLDVGGETVENGVWYYPDPVDDLADIAGYLAFYPEQFTIEAAGTGTSRA